MQPSTRVVSSAVNLDVIVRTRLLLFHLEGDERQLNVAASRCLNHPLAVGVRLVGFITKSRVRINVLQLVRSLQMSAANCGMRREESLPVDAGVRIEKHEHRVGRGRDRMRKFRPAEASQAVTVGGVSVEHCDVVVSALLMWFDLKHVEHESNPVTRRGREVPNAVLLSRVQVRVVGRRDVPGW